MQHRKNEKPKVMNQPEENENGKRICPLPFLLSIYSDCQFSEYHLICCEARITMAKITNRPMLPTNKA
jgi:hypothetical protein